jgi:hypothetical protein
VQLKIDLSTKNKDRAATQTELIKALEDLKAAKEAYEKKTDDSASQP